ncbi:MAG: SIMPL domain-containing protein [Thioalkalivibrionaceae bacterium]
MQRPSWIAFAWILSAVVLGASLIMAVTVWKQSDRVVTVRGLAERDVAADLALWPLNFSVTAQTLSELREGLERDTERVRLFLRERGFAVEDISVAPPRIVDQHANTFGGPLPPERFRATATVLLRSADVERVRASEPETVELLRRGVLLSTDYEFRTEYLFTALDRIKPEMIAAATLDARAAAQQFADDSGSRVGSIRTATQGYFSVENQDAYTPHIKRIRVVTTVDYALVD